MIEFDKQICTDFNESSTREWLETNGIGGFASSTISGANTRRYHGILTAALRPPLGRVTTLSKFEETLIIDGEKYELSANQYPNKIYPEGFKYLKNFQFAPFPVWTFQIESVEIEKKIFMIYGENTTVCRWKIKSGNMDVKLELKPLFSFVDYHSLQRETPDVEFEKREISDGLIFIKPSDDLAEIFLAHNAQAFENTGFWYRNFEYAIEKERGFDYHEDLFQPFVLKFDMSEEKEAIVFVSTEKRDVSNADDFEKLEIERREKLVETAQATDEFEKQLVIAADQFIVSRGGGKTIIAGYHWFSDWGRDTMIALPGLTLATNRTEIAKSILLEFSKYISEGMIPNRFPDVGDDAEYNTVDATLWFFEAIRAYVEKTGDLEFVEEKLYEKLNDIIEWHLKGTRYNIKVDEADGLLFAGTESSQLTWMDAKDGDTVFTPRTGKAVEIQALWYNALKITAEFAEQFNDEKTAETYTELAKKSRESFNLAFWNEETNCLFDVIKDDKRDASIRPNQIFAVSLKYSMLNLDNARKVVETVERELLTPVGLRSLSPNDVQYQEIYKGSPFERDSAYHQGTVWAWLIGGFIDGLRKTSENSAETEKKINGILENFKNHLNEAGIGQISEIFDGDAPHKPRGCIAQAWSVAEVLRVMKSDDKAN